MVLLLDSLGIAKDRVVILPMTTDNMTQTVTKVLQIAKSKYFQLVMPDTFFHGEKPYATLKDKPELVDLACWSIREEQKGKLGQVLIEENKVIDIRDKDKNCDYAYSWGALTFNRELLNYSTAQDPHIGFAVKSALDSGEDITSRIMHGKYFDCGTPSEYLEMLEKVI
jgi:hypothetical protein